MNTGTSTSTVSIIVMVSYSQEPSSSSALGSKLRAHISVQPELGSQLGTGGKNTVIVLLPVIISSFTVLTSTTKSPPSDHPSGNVN